MIRNINVGGFNDFVSVIAILLIVIFGTVLIITFSHYFAKYFLIKIIDKTLGKKHVGLGRLVFKNYVFHRIAYLIPALLLYNFADFFNFDTPHFKIYLAGLFKTLTVIYLIIGSTLVLTASLNCIHDHYKSLAIAKQRPIKSYLQVVKIILFITAGVFVVSILLDKSPAYLFAGISAATAVLLLVFKDSILGFVASIQLSAYDMVRIGDWIEMTSFGADGEVIDISLNTVKVQNFDKTIVTIPSYALLTSGLKNWRGMQEAGGRRIKRFINIDITTIKICGDSLLNRLNKIDFLKEKIAKGLLIDKKQITNIGMFRYYLEFYLKQHPGVHKEMKILIRQLQGTATGLPLELYFFTNVIESEKYEAIQADIFDHIYALLPTFELRVFQYTSSDSN